VIARGSVVIKGIGVSISLTIVAIGMTTDVILLNAERSTMKPVGHHEECVPLTRSHTEDFVHALLANPSQRTVADSMLFRDLIGSWQWTGFDYTEKGRVPTRGKWIFEVMLNGNAVQDVFIFENPSGGSPPFLEYGTTIRFPNADGKTWTAVWIGPLNKTVREFTARRENDEIIMESENDVHRPIRWIFAHLQADKFHWRGEVHDGRRWVLYEELDARRIDSN
jgi:hypothetical protein